MIMRVEVDNVNVAIDTDGAPWTPELVATLLRQCGDEALRVFDAISADMRRELTEALRANTRVEVDGIDDDALAEEPAETE